MFSRVFVCHSVERGGPHVIITHDELGYEYPLPWIPDMDPPHTDIGPQTCSLEDLLPVLTSSGGHRNTYLLEYCLVTNLSFI